MLRRWVLALGWLAAVGAQAQPARPPIFVLNSLDADVSVVDPVSFTAVRLASGAVILAPFLRGRAGSVTWSARSGLALFVYAIGFSLAYLSLDAGAGALVLFASGCSEAECVTELCAPLPDGGPDAADARSDGASPDATTDAPMGDASAIPGWAMLRKACLNGQCWPGQAWQCSCEPRL